MRLLGYLNLFSFFLSFRTFARFLQECLSRSGLMTLQRRMWPITPNKPCGDTIQLCGCCGMEHNVSQHSCSFLPASGSTCCACGKENNWRKMLTKSIRRQVVAVQGIQDMQTKAQHREVSPQPCGSWENRGKSWRTIPRPTSLPYLRNQLSQKGWYPSFLWGHSGVWSIQETTSMRTLALRKMSFCWAPELLFPGSPCNHSGIPTILSPSNTVISAFGGHTVCHYSTWGM